VANDDRLLDDAENDNISVHSRNRFAAAPCPRMKSFLPRASQPPEFRGDRKHTYRW
jgi:hypothetical protein